MDPRRIVSKAATPPVHVRSLPWVFAFAAAVALAPAPSAAKSAAATLESARALAARIAASGRAEAELERRSLDAFTGAWRTTRGRVALEPPDRARLEFPASGERIALRGDGGEWLQPALGQMLRLGPDHAASARRWWELLLAGTADRFVERPLGGRRFAVVRKQDPGRHADTAWVALDAQGLPARLEYGAAEGERVEFRLRGWKFGPARGRGAFVIAAPESVTVVDLP